MAGHVIHLAVAQEYIKKHEKEKFDYSNFIEGVLFPDSVTDKSKTHYGEISPKVNLYEFLKENKLNNQFNRGYFLHLLTDYLFYNHYISRISTDLYDDYDILNSKLIEKYKVIIPEKVKNQVFFKQGALKILSLELMEKMIKEISEMDIDIITNKINKNPEGWRNLIIEK